MKVNIKRIISGVSIIHLIFFTLSFMSFCLEIQETDELRSVAPNIFLDCERRICDMNYIRTEITFVNYVRDRQSADVHILITRQRTGSGGNEYTIAFIGRGKYSGKDSTLKYFSSSTDTSDVVRKGMVNVLKKGLVPYVVDTPLAEYISVSYAQTSTARSSQVKDKWNYWVFSMGLRGNLNFEELSKRYNYSISFSANRTTEDLKFTFWANRNYNHREYEIDESEEIISISDRKMAYTQLIKSLGTHWSAGVSLNLFSSTYDNAEFFFTLSPAVEFNVFPYEQSTRRELRIQYRIDYNRRNYFETTIFDKSQENLFGQSLQAILEVKEPWGSLGFEIEGSHFFHDFSKNNLKVEAGMSLMVFKGLDFNIGGEFSRVRDQLALPKEGASKEDILLELKQLATSYDLRISMGFSYRFGSIYSNVVNPRFGNQ
ncbi:MAG: hypothetical protein JW755_07200 [Candidatus Aminicenantes bacterium]|nr:hypothetical protein [Candidatus Aminicenantes bacterium]